MKIYFVTCVLIVAQIYSQTGRPDEITSTWVNEARERILNAKSPSQAAKEYQRLIKTLNDRQLGDLVFDANTGIAIQMAWEKSRGTFSLPPSELESAPSASVQRFAGFLEGRLQTPLPASWKRILVNRVQRKSAGIAFPSVGGPDVIPPSALSPEWNLHIPNGLSLSTVNNQVVLKSNGTSVNIPTDVIQRMRKGEQNYLSVHIGDARTLIAFFDYAGFGFDLNCIENNSGRVAWRSPVWALGRVVATGPSSQVHTVSLVQTASVAIVFGAEIHGLYIEGFDIETGTPSFRFCTSYWLHAQEVTEEKSR